MNDTPVENGRLNRTAHVAELPMPIRRSATDADIRQREREEHAGNVAILRERWGAPALQSTTDPDEDGPWGQKLASVAARLGKRGFLGAMTGERGTGKTQMAVELMKRTTERLHTAFFATAMRFFMDIKATYRKDAAETESEVLARYTKPRLLVLDEIGRRGDSEWENNLLFELCNDRYGAMKDTLLLSNLPEAELKASLGPSLVSRMQETGGLIVANWPSYRITK